MNFLLTQDQQDIRDMVREFAHREIIPRAAKIDEEDRFPRELVKQMGELGLLGIPVPEEWGGVGADLVSYTLAIEEISYASATLGVILAVHTSVGTMPIVKFGTDEQKAQYLDKMATGQLLGAFALTEPNAGSDASRITTKAVRQGDTYVLNGSKIFITNGGEADIYITFAVTDPGKGPKGISAFIVEKNTPGFRVGKKEKKMGMNGSATAELIFEDAQVPVHQLLGQEGEGFAIAMSNLDGGRIGIAAQGLGIARAAYNAAAAYVKEREQFHKPIAEFQGVQFMLADMATRIEAARLLVYRAASMRDKGLSVSKEAAIAKLFATDTAMSVATDAVQLHGGYGYTREFPAERFMRDAKVTQIYEGTNQIQRVVIAKHLLS
jgi:alkylation response protein AidB-like acyl-CoA dehydrogenase